MERAPHVCAICKARKKACDKHIPSCGYCKKRGLNCSYDLDHCSSLDNDVEIRVPFLLFCKPSELPKRKSAQKPNCIFSDEHSPSPFMDEAISLDAMLNMQVNRMMQGTGFTFQEISERYFQGFHIWLPVVCPTLLEDALSHYIVPPADVSVLTLAIYLIVLRPPSGFSQNANILGPEQIYVFVKMLASQVQARICGSVPLLQASLLISAYEYASGRPETAYISLNSCLGMAFMLGINEYRDPQTLTDEQDKLKSSESWNIWWGLVILQRYLQQEREPPCRLDVINKFRLILIELPKRNVWPRTKFPDLESALPSDLAYSDRSIFKPHVMETLERARLPASQRGHIVGFGRQAQAVELFDNLLKIMDLNCEREARLLEFTQLDRDTQAFMKLVIEESGKGDWNFRSGVEATIMRTICALHEEILTELKCPGMEDIRTEWAVASKAALNTIVKMVIDIARHRMWQNGREGEPSPCCLYSLRTARKHAEDSAVIDDESCSRLASIQTLGETFGAWPRQYEP